MIGALIIFFALIWVLTGDIRFEKKKKRILQDHPLETATFIQYDGRTVKAFGIMTIVSSIGFVISCMIADYVDPAAGVLVMVFVGMLIICLPSWLIGRSYLNRLEKMGYAIPWCSRDYDYILEKVPMSRENPEKEEYNKRSKIFALIYVYIWICMLAVNVWLCSKWRLNSGVAKFAFWAVVDVYWLIRALQFYKQMDNRKYKEDIEVDPYRKNRISKERAIGEILVMLLVVWGAKKMITNFGDAAYRAQMDHDRGWMQEIHGMMDLTYRELVSPEDERTALFTPEERASDWSGTWQQLMEGVDITGWGVPQDIYQKKIAEHLVISNFAELEEHFLAVDEDAVLIAKIEDGVLTLSLSNLKRKVDKPIAIESATPLPEK